MKNKAQGMSTSTIVLLILAVVVLVVLILGFTMGWSKIAPWLSPSNVDDIVNHCEAASSTSSNYDFCVTSRILKDSEKNKFETSCVVFANVAEFAKYGIQKGSIDCNLDCSSIKINGKSGDVSLTSGYDVSSIAKEENCFIPLN